MNIIICLDDKNGMLFNNRRQSSDIFVREKIFELASGNKIYMNEYSKRQFVELDNNIIVSNSFLNIVGKDDFCFVENTNFDDYINDVNLFVIFRWNRVYPSDVKFNTDYLKSFDMTKTIDFKGKSHDKITMEVYTRA